MSVLLSHPTLYSLYCTSFPWFTFALHAGSSPLQEGVSSWRSRGPTSIRRHQSNLGNLQRRRIWSRGKRVLQKHGNQQKCLVTSAITVLLALLLNTAISGTHCGIFTQCTRVQTHAQMCHSTSVGPSKRGPSRTAHPFRGTRAGKTCAGVARVHINLARMLHHILLILQQ